MEEFAGFIIQSESQGRVYYWSGSKIGEGFGGVYGAKIYKSEKNAQKAIDSHKEPPFWKNAKVVKVTLTIGE